MQGRKIGTCALNKGLNDLLTVYICSNVFMKIVKEGIVTPQGGRWFQYLTILTETTGSHLYKGRQISNQETISDIFKHGCHWNPNVID